MAGNHDLVNHPSHYVSGGIECIDAIKSALTREQYIGFLKGNVIKYLWRCDHKGGIEDVKKGNWYLQKLIEMEQQSTNHPPDKLEDTAEVTRECAICGAILRKGQTCVCTDPKEYD